MFLYKITSVKFCTSLRKYHNVIFAENDVAEYTLYLMHMGSYEAYFVSYSPQIFTR